MHVRNQGFGKAYRLTMNGCREQPWSTYAVHLTTLTAWAIPTDALLIYWCSKATEKWSFQARVKAMVALAAWMLMSKWIKLLGHFVRYPVDVLLFPISVAFGYLHGFLKLYAMCTVDVVSHSVSSCSVAWICKDKRRHQLWPRPFRMRAWQG